MNWFLVLCLLAAAAPLVRQHREAASPAPMEVTQRPGRLLRKVSEATRKLHPAADCFRGAGFLVDPQPIDVDQQGRHWSEFLATKNGEQRKVRERIYNAQGQEWTDVSSWWWQAALGKSQGPWYAETIVSAPRVIPYTGYRD